MTSFSYTYGLSFLHMTSLSYTYDLSFSSFLEQAGVWERPLTRVLLVGLRDGVEVVLEHHSLRNTISVLYFTLDDLVPRHPRDHAAGSTSKVQEEGRSLWRRKRVEVVSSKLFWFIYTLSNCLWLGFNVSFILVLFEYTWDSSSGDLKGSVI